MPRSMPHSAPPAPKAPHPHPGLEQSLLHGIDALAAKLGRAGQNPAHLQTGLYGEEEALFYLRRRGYTVVARRWQTPRLAGDVDLIAWDGPTLCFVEVKTRTGRDIVPAEFAVDQHKQRILRSLARVFCKRFAEHAREQIPVRFDVVAVYLSTSATAPRNTPEIEHFLSAFPY